MQQTNEKETIAVALLALRKLPQFSNSTCPSSPSSFYSNSQPHSLSDLKESLNSLEAERVRLELKCSELGIIVYCNIAIIMIMITVSMLSL
jgi:hypothetical protein